jgi:hypothetical protein
MSPVLQFDPSEPPYRERQAVLIPVWAVRVTVPETHESSLNIFERTVLELARAGVQDNEEIAGWMMISPKLAGRVRQDLKQKRLLDRQGLTERGERRLQNLLTVDPERIQTGYVYQEALTGELLQRFVLNEDSRQAKANRDLSSNSEFPAIQVGLSVDDARTIYGFYVSPNPDIEFRRPGNSDVFQASVRHKRAVDTYQARDRGREDYADASQSTRWETNGEGSEGDTASPPITKTREVNRTINIRSEPICSWMLTYVYLPMEEENPDRWTVADPFGLGNNLTLTQGLRERRKSDSALSDKIDEITESVRSNNEDRRMNQVQRAWEDAASRIENRFGPQIRDARYFSDLAATKKALEESGLGDGGEFSHPALREALTKTQRFLEGLLQALRDAYPDEECHHRLNDKSQEQRKKAANAFASQLGFGPPEDSDYSDPLPYGISQRGHGRVKQMARGEGASLRSALLYHVFAAYDRDEHPFRVLADREPSILWRLDRLAKMRNQFAAHFDQENLNRENVENYIQAGFRTVEILHPYAK